MSRDAWARRPLRFTLCFIAPSCTTHCRGAHGRQRAQELLLGRRRLALPEARGLAEQLRLVGLLPGEVVVVAAEVAVRGGLLVDRPVQIEVVAEGARP